MITAIMLATLVAPTNEVFNFTPVQGAHVSEAWSYVLQDERFNDMDIVIRGLTRVKYTFHNPSSNPVVVTIEENGVDFELYDACIQETLALSSLIIPENTFDIGPNDTLHYVVFVEDTEVFQYDPLVGNGHTRLRFSRDVQELPNVTPGIEVDMEVTTSARVVLRYR